MIVTEGKTDILYLKAALKNLWKEYPELIDKNKNGQFEYKISFLHRSKRLKYFLSLDPDGADTMNNIYYLFSDNNSDRHHFPNYIKIFKNLTGKSPINPVILLFDNELNDKNKPIYKFCKNNVSEDQKNILSKEKWLHLLENLYILMPSLIIEPKESDIEMLFDKTTRSTKINGKEFSPKDSYDTSKYYGKNIFSKYIIKNYKSINFNDFKPLLDNIKIIIQNYEMKRVCGNFSTKCLPWCLLDKFKC